MQSDLPPIRNGMSINEMFVDGTPNGTYAMRILKAYRRRCDERWEVHGLSPERTLVYDLMNKHQEERAKELDAAIEKLLRPDSPRMM